MSGYSVNIETKTLENTSFREMLFPALHSQMAGTEESSLTRHIRSRPGTSAKSQLSGG